MGINDDSDMAGDIQIGPTDRGMVRIYLTGEGFDLPLDFDPEEAEEIARELIDAAGVARGMGGGKGGGGKGGGGKGGKPKGR